MEKRKIVDEMTVLMMQLVAENQIRIARLVLQTYFVREWKLDESLASRYVRAYFAKHFPKQLERYSKRPNRASYGGMTHND